MLVHIDCWPLTSFIHKLDKAAIRYRWLCVYRAMQAGFPYPTLRFRICRSIGWFSHSVNMCVKYLVCLTRRALNQDGQTTSVERIYSPSPMFHLKRELLAVSRLRRPRSLQQKVGGYCHGLALLCHEACRRLEGF